MWHALPTCTVQQDFAHADIGWKALTKEIIETIYLVNPKCVFAFFGNKTWPLAYDLPLDSKAMCFPMPELQKPDFANSRPFAAINRALRDTHQKKIDWRL